MPQFCVGYTNMLVSKNVKICVTPTRNIKFALPPTQNPNASQWNIGIYKFCVGHVHSMLFVLISFALVTQREPSLQWNMGLSVSSKDDELLENVRFTLKYRYFLVLPILFQNPPWFTIYYLGVTADGCRKVTHGVWILVTFV